jgi:hypothetical protein
MINKITRDTKLPKGNFFLSIIDDNYCHSYNEHRRGSSFNRRSIYLIDAEYFGEEMKDYYGYWESNTYSYDENWGSDGIEELTRVVRNKKMVEIIEWVPVN